MIQGRMARMRFQLRNKNMRLSVAMTRSTERLTENTAKQMSRICVWDDLLAVLCMIDFE
jgi:hypothetical protein